MFVASIDILADPAEAGNNFVFYCPGNGLRLTFFSEGGHLLLDATGKIT
ncbi:MAG: hypothetical protein GX357_04250 [Firmicutes bacterium]|nr:hypothetical protein [Bacillota bacterium]